MSAATPIAAWVGATGNAALFVYLLVAARRGRQQRPPRPNSSQQSWCDEHDQPVIYRTGHCTEGVGCGSRGASIPPGGTAQ